MARDESPNAGIQRSEGFIPERALAIKGAFCAALPSLKCGKVYEDARLLGTTDFGMFAPVRNAAAIVDALIDLDGRPAFTKLNTSSGNDTVDALALKTARTAHYRPALFRCVPVVGRYRFRLDHTIG